MEEFFSSSENETFKIAESFGEKALAGDIYCLTGELGAGKTIFAKGFAKGLGVSDVVVSPTFAIINEYSGRLPFYHFDVYRILTPEAMEDTGYEEYFYDKGVCLIEWAENIREMIPEEAYWIKIEKDLSNDNHRKITVEAAK